MLKIAVVGTGIIAKSHLNAITSSNACRLAAVADINEDAARKAGLKYGAPYYLSYQEMTESESFDAVILNLPHYLHCEASVYFLEKGIHVLCEKPMAINTQECDKMIAASEKSGAKFAVGHIQRFFGANEIAKDFVENKTLGELCMTSERRNVYYFDEKRPRWFLDKKLSGGGIIMNYGAHALDKLFSNIGAEITEIHASYGNTLDDYDIEGHAQIKLMLNDRISSCIIFCGYTTFAVNETVYYFTDGAVRVFDSNCIEICTKRNGSFEPYNFTERVDPFNKQLDEFIKMINGEESKIADGVYSRKIIKAISDIYSIGK